MQIIRDRREGETRGRGKWTRVVEFVTPEEGCLFSYCVGTAMYVLCVLGRAGVSPGLKHGLVEGGVVSSYLAIFLSYVALLSYVDLLSYFRCP